MAGSVRQTTIADRTDGALKALEFAAPAHGPRIEHWVRGLAGTLFVMMQVAA
ncbi:hypothetical protein QO004_005093 [Rhizobium mesoamericanum]|nr:hypothetical protein [Rhizobium mesoamericanum]